MNSSLLSAQENQEQDDSAERAPYVETESMQADSAERLDRFNLKLDSDAKRGADEDDVQKMSSLPRMSPDSDPKSMSALPRMSPDSDVHD